MYISHFWGDLYAILHNGDIRFSLMCVKVYFSHSPNNTFYVLFFFFKIIIRARIGDYLLIIILFGVHLIAININIVSYS